MVLLESDDDEDDDDVAVRYGCIRFCGIGKWLIAREEMIGTTTKTN